MRTDVILLLSVACVACVGTTLEPSNDPVARPTVRPDPGKKPAAALRSGFDPFEAYGEEGKATAPGGAQGEHGGHGAHGMLPAGASSPAAGDGADHASHPKQGSQPGEPPPSATPAFTCSMHSEIVRDSPGACPICGMRLVPKKLTPTHPAH